jgi:hypothetical protein
MRDDYHWTTRNREFRAYREHDADGFGWKLELRSFGVWREIGASISLMDAHALSRMVR